MQLTIDSTELASALKKLSVCYKTTSTFPITKCVLINAKDGNLTATATNVDNLSLSITLPCTVVEEGAVVVDAQSLLNASNKQDNDITLATEGFSLRVSCGRFKLDLTTSSVSDFPYVFCGDIGTTSVDFSISEIGELSKIMTRAMTCMATEDTRPAFTGALIKLRGTSIDVVSTDGHRLAKSTMYVSTAKTEEETFHNGVILPRNAVQILAKCFSGEIRFSTVCGRRVVATDGTLTMSSHPIAGQFPDVDAVFPDKASCSFVCEVERNAMMASLKRVRDFTPKTMAVRLQACHDSFVVRTTGNDVSSSCEDIFEISDVIRGTDIVVGVNAQYLIEVLNSSESDRVSIYFVNADSPILIEDGDDARFIIMPLVL